MSSRPYVWRALPSCIAAVAAVGGTSGRAGSAARYGERNDRIAARQLDAPGAQVTVDGKARGVTPLDLRDVRPGRHEVTLASDAGSVTRTVAVSASATATIDESIFSGFAAVYAPFDVIITEQGRPLTADDRHQIMLPPGPHDLRFENRTLVYETVKQVTIEPGQVTVIQRKPDPSPLTVPASEPAAVRPTAVRRTPRTPPRSRSASTTSSSSAPPGANAATPSPSARDRSS